MAKPFYHPITQEMRHGVATLIAAGLRPASIYVRLNVTPYSLKAIQNEPGFEALLEEKKAALAGLMSGVA